MKKPYRDIHGRFAKRPHRRKVPTHVYQKAVPRRPSQPDKKTSTKKAPSRSVGTRHQQPISSLRKRHTPTRKKPTRKTTPTRKKAPKKKEWEDLTDILETYIHDLDIDEDDIGDYHDPFQAIYMRLLGKRYRHAPSLLVSDLSLIPWKSKPPRMQIWFLVYYHDEGRYNIEFRNWENGDRVTLEHMLTLIHQIFIEDQNAVFQRERESSYRHREAIHPIAIATLGARPPRTNQPTPSHGDKVGWTFTPPPTTFKRNPPWKKGTT